MRAFRLYEHKNDYSLSWGPFHQLTRYHEHKSNKALYYYLFAVLNCCLRLCGGSGWRSETSPIQANFLGELAAAAWGVKVKSSKVKVSSQREANSREAKVAQAQPIALDNPQRVLNHRPPTTGQRWLIRKPIKIFAAREFRTWLHLSLEFLLLCRVMIILAQTLEIEMARYAGPTNISNLRKRTCLCLPKEGKPSPRDDLDYNSSSSS